jgi:hypothetical protein
MRKYLNKYPIGKIMRYLTILLAILFLAGCATSPYTPPIECQAGKSLILERIPDARALDKGLMAVQLAALEGLPAYSKADAIAILNIIEERIDQGMSYANLVEYVSAKLELANNIAGAVIFIIGDSIRLLDSPFEISACDKVLIKRHIAKQKMLLTIYQKQ